MLFSVFLKFPAIFRYFNIEVLLIYLRFFSASKQIENIGYRQYIRVNNNNQKKIYIYIYFALFSYIYILDVITEKPCSKSLECNVINPIF